MPLESSNKNEQMKSASGTAHTKKGSLKIVGSGISSATQFTLETIELIKNADKVFYVVGDQTTENFIHSKNKNSVDLSVYYEDGKERLQTYVQQAEMMLRDVRYGNNVVGVFYGHPGVCVLPSYRAMAIARQEGHAVKMYPGVSALDCLFADLEIDPVRLGCTVFEARDLLVRRKKLPLSSHVVLLQPWALGYGDYSSSERTKNKKFGILVDYLEEVYGCHAHVIHYIAAIHPHAEPVVEKFTIVDLRKPQATKNFKSSSTIYLPPTQIPPFHREVGLTLDKIHDKARQNGSKKSTSLLFPPVNWCEPSLAEKASPYNDHAQRAVAALKHHLPPNLHQKTGTSATGTSKDTLNKRVLQPDSSSHLVDKPRLTAAAADPAVQFIQAMLRDPALSKAYSTILSQNASNSDSSAITAWIVQQGYNTTADAVVAAWKTMQSQSLDTYSSTYNTIANGATGPQLTISAGTVVVDGVTIKLFTYTNSVLSWNASDGNPSSAQLTFVVLTNDDGKPLPENSYIGPQFTGYYWKSTVSAKPAAPNIMGRNGAFPAGSNNQPVGPSTAGAALSVWNDTYQTYTLDSSTKQWSPQSTLTVNGGVSYNGKPIKAYTYSNDTVSWNASDGNDFSAEILFIFNVPTKTNPYPGNQFYGVMWGPNESRPTSSNFMGLIGAGTNQGGLSGASSGASALSEWRTIGIQLGVGIAVVLLATAVQKAISLAFNRAAEAYRNAMNDVNAANNNANANVNDAVANDAPAPVNDPPVPEGPVNPVDPPVNPVDPPVNPVDPPVNPVDPPVNPVDPPVGPVDPPVGPVDPPVGELCIIL